MDSSRINRWLQDLKSPDAATRERATEELWRMWFRQKGAYGAQLLLRSHDLLQAGQPEEAESLLSDLIRDQPDFAEAWNRRAVLRYTQGDFWRAIADCQQVLELIPYHFGALHGLGLCHASIGNYTAAIQAFRQAMAIQPYATLNQRLILECTARLS